MKKGHYRITLEVTTAEKNDIDGAEELEGMDFWADDGEGVEIEDVNIENVEVIG